MKLRRQLFSNIDIITIYIILVILLTMFILYYINKGIKYVLSNYVYNEINRMSTILISDVIDSVNIDNDSYINSYVNDNKEIVSIDFDTNSINKVYSNINKDIYSKLMLIESGEYESNVLGKYNDYYLVPLGLVFNKPIFSSISPKIPLKVKVIGSVSSNIVTDVVQYGINSSLIKVYIDVNVIEKLYVPFISKDVKVNVRVPIIMKIVNGKVPNVYGGNYSVSTKLE